MLGDNETTKTASGPMTALLARIEAALSAEQCDVVRTVQSKLAALLQSGSLKLDGRFYRTKPDGYARRLLHRDDAGRYTVVVMTWSPGQSTPVHDHGGIWCIDGVVEGEVEVTQYELIEACDAAHRFEHRGAVRAGIGCTGSLIPPHEYHRMANPTSEPAITIHIYGGEIRECNVYSPQRDGSYRRELRTLTYSD